MRRRRRLAVQRAPRSEAKTADAATKKAKKSNSVGERNLIPEAPAEVDDKLAFVGSAGSRKKDLKYIVVAIFWSVGERGAGSGVRSTRCERQNFGIGQYHHGHVTA